MLIALGIALAAGLGTGQAQASTYCAELPGDASCDQNFAGTTTAVQAAVAAADTHPGADTVKVGPGIFVMPSPVYLDSFGPDNTLTLVGSGPATVLRGSDPADPEIHFHAPQGSSISKLTVSIPDDATSAAKRGLVLTGDAPTADDIDVNFVTGTTGDKTTGVVLQDGATLSNSRVSLYNANVNTAVASTTGGTQTVQGSTLTAFRDVDQRNTVRNPGGEEVGPHPHRRWRPEPRGDPEHPGFGDRRPLRQRRWDLHVEQRRFAPVRRHPDRRDHDAGNSGRWRHRHGGRRRHLGGGYADSRQHPPPFQQLGHPRIRLRHRPQHGLPRRHPQHRRGFVRIRFDAGGFPTWPRHRGLRRHRAWSISTESTRSSSTPATVTTRWPPDHR